MAATDVYVPLNTKILEPGTGGRPPMGDLPAGWGGGGWGDGWNEDWYRPRNLLHTTRLFLLSVLTGDMIFLAVLALFFYACRSGPQMNGLAVSWHPVPLPRILYLNAALLVLSSVTVEFARQNIFRDVDVLEEWLGLGRPALNRALPWLAATLGLGVLFLTGQSIIWKQMSSKGFVFDQKALTSGSYHFYLMSGVHAAHLLIGIAALVFCLSALSRVKRVEIRQIAIDLTAWYWHALSLSWFMLLGVLATGQ